MTKLTNSTRTSLKAMGLATLIFTCSSVFAQEQKTSTERSMKPKIGIKGGVNFSNLYVDDVSDENTKIGFHGGVFAKLPISKGFSIQPELLFTNTGTKLEYNNIFIGEGEYRFNLNYIQLPVLAVFNVTKNINIHAGPYASYLAAANLSKIDKDADEIEGLKDLKADDFNRLDYGVAGGVGFDVQNFTFGARYNYGLNEVGKDKDNTSIASNAARNAKNSNFQLYIGFGF